MRKMVGKSVVLAALLAAGATWTIAAAQDPPPLPPPQKPKVFVSYEDAVLPNVGGQTIDHGTPTPRDAFKALFYIFQDTKICSAAVVGERVVLTAAHCVFPVADILLDRGGKTIEGACNWPATYPAANADYALCLMKEDIAVPFEVVNVAPARLVQGNDLLLAGFGCNPSDPDPAKAGLILFRTGPTAIDALPAGDQSYITVKGRAATCLGDSGGPAFMMVDGAKDVRLAVGVNAERVTGTDMSRLSSTSSAVALSFFTKWTCERAVKICGFSKDAKGCRSISEGAMECPK